jgi:hypothetical protein
MARLFHVGLLLLTTAVLRADSLAAARLARELLGPDAWSRVVRVENRRADLHHPAEFHALVFALEDRLWFYNPSEGTQSLSVYAGRLDQDKADPAALVRLIVPGLVRLEEVTAAAPGANPASLDASNLEADFISARPGRPTRASSVTDAPLPFGCFIKCVARWRTLQGSLFPPDEAGVLVFYIATSCGPHGHSVLVYRTNGQRYVYDSMDGEHPLVLPAGQDPSPLQIARTISTLQKPFKAQLLALRRPGHAPGPTVATSPPGLDANAAIALARESPAPVTAAQAALF